MNVKTIAFLSIVTLGASYASISHAMGGTPPQNSTRQMVAAAQADGSGLLSSEFQAAPRQLRPVQPRPMTALNLNAPRPTVTAPRPNGTAPRVSLKGSAVPKRMLRARGTITAEELETESDLLTSREYRKELNEKGRRTLALRAQTLKALRKEDANEPRS